MSEQQLIWQQRMMEAEFQKDSQKTIQKAKSRELFQKQAQLRLRKLGPGTVLIFHVIFSLNKV